MAGGALRRRASPWLAAPLLLLGVVCVARADSVAQVQTAKRISRETVAVIDPERGTSVGGGVGDVRVAPGDVLTFIFRFTPVPNGAVRGLGGYITEYVPPNTEVVGARIIDAGGHTVLPHRGGLAADGWGPRGSRDYSSFSLLNGSISQLYADTGIFYSTDSRTARVPADQLITVTNGIVMSPVPTGGGQLDSLVGVPSNSAYYAHNLWDWVQVMAFGSSGKIGAPLGGDINTQGTGNTPFGYGSAVAGPETFYPYEATQTAATLVQPIGAQGPWKRIRTPGAETGVGSAATSAGTTLASTLRVGVPTSAGFDLSTLNPLPQGTNAVRYAVGELVAGDEYFAEISLRVLATPIDPGLMENANCAEVFGGDASARAIGTGGKDNTWRYYLPSPACVALNLLFDLDVDRIIAKQGEIVTYTIDARNLSTSPQTNVHVTDTLGTGLSFLSATGGATFANGVITWPTLASWAPSATFHQTVQATVTGNSGSTLDRATYVSTERPAGFSTVALTDLGARAILRLDMSVTPQTVTPPNQLHYTAVVHNIGNGVASGSGCATPGCQYIVTLPPNFAIVAGTSYIDGVKVANPALSGGRYVYTSGLASVPAGGSATLTFDVDVAAGAATGLATSCLETWLADTGAGNTINDSTCSLAEVAVGAARATPPTVSGPIAAGATCVSGTSSEPDGSTVHVFLNGIERGTATVTAGVWQACSLPPTFGGQEVTAAVSGSGLVVSLPSSGKFVTNVASCNDGVDNDGDGLVDYPADPGCTDASDGSESDVVTACNDGVDNDNDGLIDLADNGCCGTGDSSEAGLPECGDGTDNDGDGLVDFGNDSGCSSVGDACEIDLGACWNGTDDDGDLASDFPTDTGCNALIDDDERTPVSRGEGRPRLLLVMDTSGSMTFDVAGNDTFGDGSVECPTAPSDLSRLSRIRHAASNVINAFGEPEYGLMRFKQTPRAFSCGGLFPSGGWVGAGAVCGALDAGELLVGFAPDNQHNLLAWMDGKDNYPGTPPLGHDVELRGSGATPLAGTLRTAYDYLQQVRAGDPRAACRPYRVVLLTDGAETCETAGDAQAAAAALCALGADVTVIGFAAVALQADLDALADAGCTGQAVIVDDEVTLASVLSNVVSSSILVERCNGMDDDCDGLIDEGFPGLGSACKSSGFGACQTSGSIVCTADGLGTECNAVPGAPGTEVCNGIDDNCNKTIDEGLSGCVACVPQSEVCNGSDDDCDLKIDEDFVPAPCGFDAGACQVSMTQCIAGEVRCPGAEPAVETCNDIDDDCDGIVDGITEPCYTGNTGCDLATGKCVGACRLGFRVCAHGAFGACMNERKPSAETCDCFDDDCDGTVDDGATCAGGGKCTQCSCGLRCDPGQEFSCPAGQRCSDGFCVADPCAAVSCAAGEVCRAGKCHDSCESVHCGAGERCADGRCIDDTCATTGCEKGELCRDQKCVADPCAKVDCAAEEVCNHDSGECVPDPCIGKSCSTAGEICDSQTGDCIVDPCNTLHCGPMLVCDRGGCVEDLCLSVQCAVGEICERGECTAEGQPDAGETDEGRFVVATGGGGCSCDVAGASRDGRGPLGFAFGMLAIGWLRRRRRR